MNFPFAKIARRPALKRFLLPFSFVLMLAFFAMIVLLAGA